MTAPRLGKVLTFYSYKGGVGRSMALANVAVLLASNGHKILVVDWDLEAPGIEQYFRGHIDERKERKEHRHGVVDLMQARGRDSELDWRKCITRAVVRGSEIHILGAGQRSPAYANALASLSWKDLFANHDLGRYLEQLRTEWSAAYDFVLVDSRTGITDIGGICTIHLPDIVIALFTSNEQSLAGVVQVMRDARREHAALPVDRSRLLILPLPARDESQSEHQRSEEWYARFARELDEFYRDWLPAKLTAAEALDILRIPYKAYWSFGEPLPVIEEGISRPTSLGYAYALVASLVESGFDWNQMTAGRYSMDRSLRTIDVPAPARPSLSLRVVALVLAGAFAIVAGALALRWFGESPSDRGDAHLVVNDPVEPPRGVDAGPPTVISDRRAADVLLAAAGRTEVALQRVLLLREIPARVFPAAEVKELLKGLVVPEAVFRSDTSDGYFDARFDRRGGRVALARRSGAVVVAAGGRGPQITVPAAPPLGLAAFSADGGHVIIADGTGMTIRDANTGAEAATVDYFAEHPARFVAIAEGDDGARSFLLAGPGGSAGTRNALFAVDARGGRVERWWDALRPLRAIDFHNGRLWFVTAEGALYAMSRPRQPEPIAPSPGAVDSAVIARGHVAMARGDRLVARTLDRKGADIAEIKLTAPAAVQGNPPYPTAGFASIAVGNLYLAAAIRSSVEIAPLTTRSLNESVRLAAGDAAMVATSGNWLLAGSSEGSVEMWRLGNNSYHVVLHRAQRSPLQRIAFSPDGRRALGVWRDGTVRVWRVQAGGVVDNVSLPEVGQRLRDATSACLSVEERLQLLPAESAVQARAATDACLAAAEAPPRDAPPAAPPSETPADDELPQAPDDPPDAPSAPAPGAPAPSAPARGAQRLDAPRQEGPRPGTSSPRNPASKKRRYRRRSRRASASSLQRSSGAVAGLDDRSRAP
jgi:cellulose biosynthesis protein BcsQ